MVCFRRRTEAFGRTGLHSFSTPARSSLEQTGIFGKTIGGIDTTCFLGVCASFGAQIGAQTTGRVGLDYSLTVNGGSFDLLYPGQTTITVPTGTSGTPGNPGP